MRALVFGLLALGFGAVALAQAPVTSGSQRLFHSYVGPQTIVRDGAGVLYMIHRYAASSLQQELAIARSTDHGKTWSLKWQDRFAYNTTSDLGNYGACMAIDSQGNLHCAWFHQVAATGTRIPRTIRYNRFDAGTSTWGAEATLTPAKFELNEPCLAVDQNDFVWLAYGTAASSWRTVVERSDKPFAPDLKFSPVSPAFSSTATSQKVSMIVDAFGRIHLSYYENGGTGGAGVKHQWLDPAASTPSWTFAALSGHGTNASVADYWSSLAADAAGNVYAVYTMDDQPNTSGPDPQFFLGKWDGATRQWGTPVLIHKVARTTWEPASGLHNDGRIIRAACDETSGELYFTYRDFGTGEWILARWRDGDPQPTPYAVLMSTPSGKETTRNYFLYPQMRGSIHPRSNRTGIQLDLLYTVGDQTATTPSYTLFYEAFSVASLTSADTPKIGTAYDLDLAAVADGGKPYLMGMTASGLGTMLRFGRRRFPLVLDSFFYASAGGALPSVFVGFQGALASGGTGQARVVIPPIGGLVGVKADVAYVTYDAAGIRAVSNPWGFQIVN